MCWFLSYSLYVHVCEERSGPDVFDSLDHRRAHIKWSYRAIFDPFNGHFWYIKWSFRAINEPTGPLNDPSKILQGPHEMIILMLRIILALIALIVLNIIVILIIVVTMILTTYIQMQQLLATHLYTMRFATTTIRFATFCDMLHGQGFTGFCAPEGVGV